MNIELIKKIVASVYSKGVNDGENGNVTSTDDAVVEWLASEEAKGLLASGQAKVDVKSKQLTTLLAAAGARRHVRCHDGSGDPFDAYDIEISDRVVDELRKEMWALEDKVSAAASKN